MIHPVSLRGEYSNTWSRWMILGILAVWACFTILIANAPLLGAIIAPPDLTLGHFLYVANVGPRPYWPDSEIYLSHVDGAYPVNLSGNSARDHKPTWSPDGRLIAFESSRDDNPEIYLVDVHSSTVFNLTRHPARDTNPVWSPNAPEIAFRSMRDVPEERSGELYVMDAFGRRATRLTQNTLWENQFVWSPDGTQIAFVGAGHNANQVYVRELYVINGDGTGQRQLTTFDGEVANPAWSPDGTQIAFESNHNIHRAIHIIDSDGNNLRQLTNVEQLKNSTWFDSRHPVWSPDGRHILYEGWIDQEYRYDIFIINADGRQVCNLSHFLNNDANPAWSPDGQQILFQSWRNDSNAEIYVMDADGSNVRRITYWERDDWEPQWMPYSP